MNFNLGPYQKDRSSRLKIESGNYPGHGKIPEPPAGARVGYSILDDAGKWLGFVELTYPFHKKPWPKDKAYIGVGVLPEYRGHGLARRAILEMMSNHPEIKEWIWSAIDSNEPSLKLGEQLGFKLRDKSKGFTNMIKMAALAHTDSASFYVVPPEKIQAIVAALNKRKLSISRNILEAEQVVRDAGGAVLYTGGDGDWDIAPKNLTKADRITEKSHTLRKVANVLTPKFPRTTKLLQSFPLAIRPKPGYSISRQLAR